MRNRQYLALATTLIVAIPGSSMATNGYFSHGYGAKSKAMAGAGVAMSMDAMAAATNPAGMADVGNRFDVGADLFIPDRNADISYGAINDDYDGNGKPFFVIPEFGYNRQLSDKVSLGISVYANGGMNTKYDEGIYSKLGNPANAGERTGIDLAQLFFAPTLTYKVNDNHAIGASLNIVYQRFKATGLSDFRFFTRTGTASQLSDLGYDDSFGAGVKLGWTGKVSDTLTLGAAYQSRTYMARFNKYSELFAENGDFDIPANYTIGAAWKATPKTTLAFDIQHIEYGSVKSIANSNNGQLGNTYLGDDDGKGFGWDDMTIFKLGVEHKYSEYLTLRAGISHGEQPIGHDDTDFNLIAPAVIENHLTLGATWMMKNGSELTAFYMHAFENSQTGDGSASADDADKISMSQDSVGISYGWDF
jgi:long-chain fatty acid transport protein